MCGFDVLQGSRAVPSKDAYTHFLRNLLKRADRIEAMFGELLRRLSEVLPDLGRHLAVDGKELNTAAAKRSNEDTAELRAKHGARPEGRRDLDSLHELPLAYEVTPANEGEQPWLMKRVERLDGSHPEIVSRAEEIAADKGYDTVENCSLPFDRYGIKPVIAIRDVRNDGETSWLLNPKKPDNVTHTYDGCVRCTCFVSDEERAMAFCGYEADRRTLKYRCPAKVHGFPCRGRGRCPRGLKRAGKIVRIPLETDRRVFTPLARGTKAWKRAYARRTAVERVNSRFDQVYGFEHHHIRGLAKMRVRVGLAFVGMLANALGWIRAKQSDRPCGAKPRSGCSPAHEIPDDAAAVRGLSRIKLSSFRFGARAKPRPKHVSPGSRMHPYRRKGPPGDLRLHRNHHAGPSTPALTPRSGHRSNGSAGGSMSPQ